MSMEVNTEWIMVQDDTAPTIAELDAALAAIGDSSIQHSSGLHDHDLPAGTGATVVDVTLIDPNQRL